VYAGLKRAAQFAKMLGKEVAFKRWDSAAEEIKNGILTHLIVDGRILKSVCNDHGELHQDATIDVSSFYGLFRFGVLDVGDERLVQGYQRVQEKLNVGSCGGIARYEGDNYFRASANVPGNPWVITTLWCAEYEIARATTKKDLVGVRGRLQWVLDRTNSAGLLSEQYHAELCTPTSVTPLTWSHAQYVSTFLAYIEKLQSLGLCDTTK
jgi:GH15 family glucan-1,4-alpha-glucosidase